MKKTIDVQEFKDHINHLLTCSEGQVGGLLCNTQHEKAGLCLLAEHFLSKTGNYKGYANITDDKGNKGEFNRKYY